MNDSDSAVLDEPIVSTAKPKPTADTNRKRQPPYAVIVLNDDRHTFQYVIELLGKVCGYSEEKAFLLAAQIHTAGRAIVWTGTMELAELKRDQIRGYGDDLYASKPVTFPLGVYIEPLPE